MSLPLQEYYIRGSIPDTSQVFIVTVDADGILYYLTVIDETIQFMPNAGSLFSFQTSNSGVRFTTISGGTSFNLTGVGEKIDDVSIAEGDLTTLPSIVEPVTVEASNYATLLVGVEYTFFMMDGLPIAFNSSTGIFQTTVRFLPSVIYPMGLCTDPITDINQIKSMEQDWVNGLKPDKGFANLDACSQGVFFDYCSYKQICSTSCKGICPDGISVCAFVDDQFQCVVEKTTSFSFLWAIIILIIVVVFAIMFFLFLSVHHREDRMEIPEQF
uniref:Uncharacterized protein n=1 Tax=Pithovirus LCPAC401 TaxID=2506595 RepID=A0A481Z932_9VIRU|nr:MAG: uncharacterized protein LCPAC401_00420 [Pithovirus LCPAC401]